MGVPKPRISSIEAVVSFLTLDFFVSCTFSILETFISEDSLEDFFLDTDFYFDFKKLKASSKEKELLSALRSSF